jgi:hypothetical protein
VAGESYKIHLIVGLAHSTKHISTLEVAYASIAAIISGLDTVSTRGRKINHYGDDEGLDNLNKSVSWCDRMTGAWQ